MVNNLLSVCWESQLHGYDMGVSLHLLQRIQHHYPQVIGFKVFRYSFSETIPIFLIAITWILSMSDRYKIFASD